MEIPVLQDSIYDRRAELMVKEILLYILFSYIFYNIVEKNP